MPLQTDPVFDLAIKTPVHYLKLFGVKGKVSEPDKCDLLKNHFENVINESFYLSCVFANNK